MPRKLIIALGFVILLALAIGTFYATSSISNANDTRTNDGLEFTLKSTAGETVKLTDYRGKVVLVNVWATWCAPCVREIPDLVALRKKYQQDGFEVLGLVVNSKETQVRQMMQRLEINYPVLWAEPAALATFGDISSIPRTFILNPAGQIVEDITGMRSHAEFEALVLKHLGAAKS